MSSLSARSESESFVISGKNIFLRAPRIKATQAARLRQRFGDFAQRSTAFVRVGLAATIGEIKECTSASWSAQLPMRSSHDSNSLNARSPNSASSFSSKNTAATFSSSTEPTKSSSATATRKSSPRSFRNPRRKPTAARRKSAVYHPCDLISSLKNHCTPAACSADPPSFKARRISLATCAGVSPLPRVVRGSLGLARAISSLLAARFSRICRRSTAGAWSTARPPPPTTRRILAGAVLRQNDASHIR